MRSFTVGISPIALADSSGANFICDISDCVGDVVGLSEADVRSALASILGDRPKAIDSLMCLIQQYYNGFHFGREGVPELTPPLYHTQLCIYFFLRLCSDSRYLKRAIAGPLTIPELTDSNTKVSENVVSLLIRQSEFAGLITSSTAVDM